MQPKKWTNVASCALMAGENPSVGEVATPAGELSVLCYRNPETELHSAPYLIVLERANGESVEVEASQQDLIFLAYGLLGAALEGWPVELRRDMTEVFLPSYYGKRGGDA